MQSDSMLVVPTRPLASAATGAPKKRRPLYISPSVEGQLAELGQRSKRARVAAGDAPRSSIGAPAAATTAVKALAAQQADGGGGGGGGGGATALPRPRWSPLEALPDAVLCQVCSYLTNLCVLSTLARVSRRLRLRALSPDSSANVCFFGRGCMDARRVLERAPPARWGALHMLSIVGVSCRSHTGEEERPKGLTGEDERPGGLPDREKVLDGLRSLGPRLRVLHADEQIDLALVPALVWPRLHELSVELSLFEPVYDEHTSFFVPPALALRRLERLALSLPYDSGVPTAVAICARGAAYLAAATPGRLRTLVLDVWSWGTYCPTAEFQALHAHAPHLESLRLRVRECSFDALSISLPPLPNAHTLVFCGRGPTRICLASAPHPKLTRLVLEGRAYLDVGSGPGEERSGDGEGREAPEGKPQGGSGGGGARWQAPALQTLCTSRPSTERARRALVAPGGCGPLRVLSVRECGPDVAHTREVDAALAFAEALASRSAVFVQVDFGELRRAKAGDAPQQKIDLAPYVQRLVAWPCVRELWLHSQAWPHLRSWKHARAGPALKVLHICGKACKRPHALAPQLRWQANYFSTLSDAETTGKRCLCTSRCPFYV